MSERFPHEWVVETELWTGGEGQYRAGSPFFKEAKFPPKCSACGATMPNEPIATDEEPECPVRLRRALLECRSALRVMDEARGNINAHICPVCERDAHNPEDHDPSCEVARAYQ